MALSNELRRLTRHFLDSYDDRMVQVTDIRATTAQELATLKSGREAMAHEEHQRLAGYAQGLHQDVENLLQELAADREAAASGLRQELATLGSERGAVAREQHQRLTGYALGLHRGVGCLLRELGEDRAADARAQRQCLTGYALGLHRDVGALVEELRLGRASLAQEQRRHLATLGSQREAMAREQHQRLAEYVAGIHRGIEAMLQELDIEHQAMASGERQRLAEYASGLRREVADLLRELAADREELRSGVEAQRGATRADLDEAHRLWGSFTRLMGQRRARKGTPPRPAEEAPPSSPEADDLTLLRGIGSNMQARLSQAGITTYLQLARSTPEELRQALGEVARLANVENWVAQARERAGLS